MFDLKQMLQALPNFDKKEKQLLTLPGEHCTPGVWSLICALAKNRRYTDTNIEYASRKQKGYAQNIKLQACLDGVDKYRYERVNDGRNYSPLVWLENDEATDSATQTINSCIRSILNNESPGTIGLQDIVGELHGNVWAHGMASGFSMAQKWNVPNENDHYIEFALSDIGMGFARELTRVGTQISSDQEAISWCIQEGFTTKRRTDDDWAQRVPPDNIGGNPYGQNVATFTSDNHHQGLGLYKLTKLVRDFNGLLYIASGASLFCIDETGKEAFYDIPYWQGVAISCRFKESQLNKPDQDPVPPEVKNIIDLLKRR